MMGMLSVPATFRATYPPMPISVRTASEPAEPAPTMAGYAQTKANAASSASLKAVEGDDAAAGSIPERPRRKIRAGN